MLGLTRSSGKAEQLLSSGIEPVIGSMQVPSSFRDKAREAQILIHAAVDYSAITAVLDETMVDNLLSISEIAGAKTRVVYTSGVWVYGEVKGSQQNEYIARNAAEAVSWRPSVEDKVLAAGGNVVRPGIVYGYGGGERLTGDCL